MVTQSVRHLALAADSLVIVSVTFSVMSTVKDKLFRDTFVALKNFLFCSDTSRSKAAHPVELEYHSVMSLG